MPKHARQDSLDLAIENALAPGEFIAWDMGMGFVEDLRRVQAEIDSLGATDPKRAVRLYETFLAGCIEKADEIDDSDGELGAFAGGLCWGWIKARQDRQSGRPRNRATAAGVDG
jgi:hypothetical protein